MSGLAADASEAVRQLINQMGMTATVQTLFLAVCAGDRAIARDFAMALENKHLPSYVYPMLEAAVATAKVRLVKEEWARLDSLRDALESEINMIAPGTTVLYRWGPEQMIFRDAEELAHAWATQ